MVGADLDGLAAKRAMVGSQGPGLVGKALPVVGRSPRQGGNIMGEDVRIG